MTEFSAVGRLEVKLDERSLSRAESKLSERMGSVRPTVETDGGARQTGSLAPGRSTGSIGGVDSPTALLGAQLETLEDIHETIEKMAVSQSGGSDGGSGLLDALGARALLGGVGGTSTAAAAGGAGIVGGAFAANAKYGKRSNLEVVGRSIMQSGGSPAGAATQAGAQIGRSIGMGDAAQSFVKSVASKFSNVDLPPLPLPSREQVSKLVLGPPDTIPALDLPDSVPTLDLPDSIPTLNLPESIPSLGLPSSVPTLDPPIASSLPSLDITDDLPSLDVTSDLPTLDVEVPDWLKNLGVGGGGSSQTDESRSNTAAERSKRSGDATVNLDFTAEGMNRREVEQAIDDAVENAKQELQDVFS